MMGYTWVTDHEPDRPASEWRWAHRSRRVRVDVDALTAQAAVLLEVAGHLTGSDPAQATAVLAVATELMNLADR